MADIVIRGMEMPLRCINCPFEMFLRGDNYCRANGGKRIEFRIGNDIGTNCPLVPLPEGHGRLIDADAFHSPEDLNNAPTIIEAEGGGGDGN